ncbi:hypothetical protein GW17_00007337 [Ensete ventricosum]|nr:hypothetical protein GW17_00007337 [Ensete ventricosum]
MSHAAGFHLLHRSLAFFLCLERRYAIRSERLKSNFRRSSLPLPPVPLLLFLFLPLSSLLRTVVSYCSCRDHCERKHHKNGKHKESFCLPPPPPRPAPAVTLPGKRDRRRSCAARWVADSALARPPRLRLLLSSAPFLAGIATGIRIDSCCHRSRGGTRSSPAYRIPGTRLPGREPGKASRRGFIQPSTKKDSQQRDMVDQRRRMSLVC